MAIIRMARQLQKSLLWHMTDASDEEGSVWPIGACARECPGHLTAELAHEHFKQGQIETARFRGACQWTKCSVPGCPAPANKTADLDDGGDRVSLCNDHLNKEGLREALQ